MPVRHRRPRLRPAVGLSSFFCLVACLLVGPVACKARLGPANADDDLREQNLELRTRVDELEQKLARRTAQIDAMRQADAHRAEARAAMPDAERIVLTELKLGGYTGLIDNDGDGTPDVARAYVRPLNQRGRLTPVSGRAVLRVIGLPDIAADAPADASADAGERADARRIAERVYEPADWDDAYRSGFTGTHYTLEAGLPAGSLEGLSGAILRVVFIEADTGIRLEAQAPRSITR
jgi:hypothetical protein